MRRLFVPLLASLLGLPASCKATAESPAPESVTLEALYVRLAPRPGEKAVLANFWATW